MSGSSTRVPKSAVTVIPAARAVLPGGSPTPNAAIVIHKQNTVRAFPNPL